MKNSKLLTKKQFGKSSISKDCAKLKKLHDNSCHPPFYIKPGNQNKFKMNSRMKRDIWISRMTKTYHLLLEGYSVFLTDIDSLWNYHVDLKQLPKNFDVLHAVAGNHPDYIKVKWGFTLCGGLALYRPTEPVLNMWKLYLKYCTEKSCDDQTVINQGYFTKGVIWFDVNRTRQKQCVNSPIGYHKIGVVNTNKIKNLQIMVVSEKDMFRGGTEEDCKTIWIMNPHTLKKGNKKREMFDNDFRNCVPFINKRG